MNLLTIENRGQAIVTTNYWDSEHARKGLLFLSWNAGAARLLVPDSQKPALLEMHGAREVIVSRGPWQTPQGLAPEALELLWEDGSDSPFAVHLVAAQTDRLIPEEQQGGGFVVAAWTRGGMKHRWPGRYRMVEELPFLKPWDSH